MTVENKNILKKELTQLKFGTRITEEILKKYDKKEKKIFVDSKLLELNITLTKWALKNSVITENDIVLDSFFTKNENLTNYVNNVGIGAMGATGIGGGALAFNIATAPVFLGFGGGITAIGSLAMVTIAAPILIASTAIYGVLLYRNKQYVEELIIDFNKEVLRIFDFYNLKLNQIKIETLIDFTENVSNEKDTYIELKPKIKENIITLEEKYKSIIALLGIYISLSKNDGKIKIENRNYIEYIMKSYADNNEKLYRLLNDEINRFIKMEDININKLGLIIHKDKEVTIGIKEYEVCFQLITLDYFSKQDIKKSLKDLRQYFEIDETIYKEMEIKYLDFNSCTVYYNDRNNETIIRYKDTEKNKQNGLYGDNFSSVHTKIIDNIVNLIRKSTIEVIFIGKKEYYDELVNSANQYKDREIKIRLKG